MFSTVMNDLQVLWQNTEMSMYKKKKKRSHFKSNIKYILKTYFFLPRLLHAYNLRKK